MKIRNWTFALTLLALCAACGSRNIGSSKAGRAPSGQRGTCGDRMLQANEACDGSVGTMSCEGLGFTGGTLRCDPDTCKYDVRMCTGPGSGTGGTGA